MTNKSKYLSFVECPIYEIGADFFLKSARDNVVLYSCSAVAVWSVCSHEVHEKLMCATSHEVHEKLMCVTRDPMCCSRAAFVLLDI